MADIVTVRTETDAEEEEEAAVVEPEAAAGEFDPLPELKPGRGEHNFSAPAVMVTGTVSKSFEA